jgi:hypothetical protein
MDLWNFFRSPVDLSRDKKRGQEWQCVGGSLSANGCRKLTVTLNTVYLFCRIAAISPLANAR